MSVERRLIAILAADVVGYSRLMGVDEEGTLAQLSEHRRELIDAKLAEHHGRLVKTTGDGMLVEFASAVDAVRCAVEFQRGMAERNMPVPPERRIQFRIGINVGDVILDGGDIFGDGVNVAARLQEFADAGGICVSSRVHEDATGKVDVVFEDAGEPALKNIERPIRVFRIRLAASPANFAAELALPGKPSIAVLPFTNMSGDPEQEYFSDGITDDIITALSRLRWFFVIARNSTFVYKGKAVDIKQIGREFGVRYVLEGSVRKSGGRVRITGQLIDAVTGKHIWAERYDHELNDIFAVQDAITQSIAGAIEPKLLAAEGLRAESRSTEDLSAWDLVARAVSHFWKLTAEESGTATTMLQKAVRLYPNYAPAHGMLAFALLVATHQGWSLSDDDRRSTTELAQRAIELDDSDPWGYLALGYLAFTSRQTDEAVRAFRVALDLNPNFAAAHGYVGWALTFDGRSDEAIQHLQQAIRMSPRDPLNGFFLAGLSAANYLAERYPEAVEWARKAVQERPGILGGHRILCASLAQAGQVDEARAHMEQLRKLQPSLSVAWIEKSVPYTAGPMLRFLEGMRKAGLET